VNDEIAAHLQSAPGITVRFLTRVEIENHLLDPDTIARVSGAAKEMVAVRLAEVHVKLHDVTRRAFTAAWIAAAPPRQTQDTLQAAEILFDSLWSDVNNRVSLVRGSLAIEALNGWLESEGYRGVSGLSLARSIRPQALDGDLLTALLAIDELVH
jgi:hypothetical protein